MNPNTNVLGAGGAGGAVAVILVWIINTVFPAVPIPDPVAQSFTILCIIGAGYVIPEERRRRNPDRAGERPG